MGGLEDAGDHVLDVGAGVAELGGDCFGPCGEALAEPAGFCGVFVGGVLFAGERVGEDAGFACCGLVAVVVFGEHGAHDGGVGLDGYEAASSSSMAREASVLVSSLRLVVRPSVRFDR